MTFTSRDLAEVADAHRAVQEELVRFSTPVADRVRSLLDAAVHQQDAEAIYSEGHQWSGRIGLLILELAERVDSLGSCTA